MSEANNDLVFVWDDVVSFRQLLLGMVLGAALAIAGYMLTAKILAVTAVGLSPGLIKGYTMLGGLAGAVLSGVIAARLFKPKRVFEVSVVGDDIVAALLLLEVDPAEEAQALEKASPRILKELEQLQLLDAFKTFARQKTVAR